MNPTKLYNEISDSVRQEGRIAYHDGKKLTDNPYEIEVWGKDIADCWEDGWHYGASEAPIR